MLTFIDFYLLKSGVSVKIESMSTATTTMTSFICMTI